MALDIEPYGDYVQSIAYCYGIFEPTNGSWIQAICEQSLITEPLNGSWELALAYYYYEGVFIPIEPFEEFEIKNGNYWQTICYYGRFEQSIEEFIGVSGVNYPINGSWENNAFQLIVVTDGGGSIPMPA